MKDKLILADGTAIELEAGASLDSIKVLADDRETMVETWKKLTDDNLAEVQVQTGEGLTVGRYKELTLVSETSAVHSDGKVLTTYRLREKTEVEQRLDNLEAEQEVQNGAIEELGLLAAGGEV